MSFTIDVVAFEVLMLIYISFSVSMWAISHAIKFLR